MSGKFDQENQHQSLKAHQRECDWEVVVSNSGCKVIESEFHHKAGHFCKNLWVRIISIVSLICQRTKEDWHKCMLKYDTLAYEVHDWTRRAQED